MQMLAKLNFARFVILATFLGSAAMGYLLYQQSQELDAVQGALARAPQRLQKLQGQALQVSELLRQTVDEGLGRQADPEDYIRQIARDKDVEAGSVEVKPDDNEGPGYRDNVFKILPERDKSFSLGKIANFMYLLESRSRRVRVTEVEIKPMGKRGMKEHDVLPGEWTFELEMTTREKIEG
ncbi:MAG: hypothetical protein AAFZ65_06425 [Planctomycetota bacterium]